jgi:HEAT repeat protein
VKRGAAAHGDVDAQLAALDALPAERGEKIGGMKRALERGHYRVAAKAARLAEDALLYDLVPSLVAAYARFLDKPLKTDPSCFAKKALARALVALDYGDSEFFRRGLAYRQLEPVWGGTADTAVDVRASCAMGLVASGYPRALVELTGLLHDGDAGARLGAVRAIACGNPREAELLLRSKALAGDAEPQVLGECFTGLLAVEPEHSLELVAGFLEHADEAVRELAALALGESRLDGALAPLMQAWNGVLVGAELRRILLRAAAAHRSEAAFDWLLALVAEARVGVVADVIDALAPYKHNAKLMQRLGAAVEERGDPALLERFAAATR